MSRNEFAEQIGIHPQTLYMYEKGKRIADVELIQQICDRFNVSVEWIVMGNGSMYNDSKSAVVGESKKLETELKEKNRLLDEQNIHIQELTQALLQAQAEMINMYKSAINPNEQ